MEKKTVILQSNYLPWKGYFDLINDSDTFCFYDEVKYTKNDWRNRNQLYTKNGLQWISIPINKDAVNKKISEVELPENWQNEHYKTIKYAYGRAPYFSNLLPFMEDFYKENNFKYLSEFNQYSIQQISKFIGIRTNFVNSKNFDLRGDKVQRLINLIKNIEATEYITGPSALNYLSGQEHLFSENNIKLTYKNYTNYPEYKQLTSPFENYVSIFDLLANIHKDEILHYICSRKK